MGLARRINRGSGERNQIRELRSSDYPQMNLINSIIPDAVNTTVSGTEIIAIRCNNFAEPHILNYALLLNGSATNTFCTPFLNIKKSTNGRGATFSRNLSTANRAVATNSQRVYKGAMAKASSISSWESTIAISGGGNGAFVSNFSHTITGNSNFKFALVFEARTNSYYIPDNYFETLKGGVNYTNTQFRDSNIADFYNVNGEPLGVGFTTPNGLPSDTSMTSYRYLLNGIEPIGTLTYSENSTNQNMNAAWLLRQRTQYHRSFNKLKTLGV